MNERKQVLFGTIRNVWKINFIIATYRKRLYGQVAFQLSGDLEE